MKLDTEKVIYSLMWWIQDLRDRGKGGGEAPIRTVGMQAYYFGQFPPENYTKMKKNGPRRRGRASLAPPWIRQCKFVKGKFPW